MKVIVDKVNVLYGLFITVLSAIFGKYWFLFAGFLALNVVDYITGYIKAKFYVKNESSAIGAKGIFKKVGYWTIIGIAFWMAFSFTHMGTLIGQDLTFMQMLGWFTLATYIINEIRSILENFVEMNINVPPFLIQGLAITEKRLNKKAEIKEEEKWKV